MTGAAKKRPIKAAREAAQKAMMWLWIKRADLFGCYWKAWTLPCFHPRLGRWVMMMGDPKHPMTPGYITEDAYQEMCHTAPIQQPLCHRQPSVPAFFLTQVRNVQSRTSGSNQMKRIRNVCFIIANVSFWIGSSNVPVIFTLFLCSGWTQETEAAAFSFETPSCTSDTGCCFFFVHRVAPQTTF